MPKVPLSLSTIDQVSEGAFAKRAQMELDQIGKDLLDRPLEKGARKLTITIEAKPVPADTDLGVEAELRFTINSTLPKRKTGSVIMSPLGNGALLFRPDSEDNPDQMNIGEAVDPETGELRSSGD